MSWLSRDSSSHGAHIAATAVISGIVVAATIFGAQAVRRQLKVDHLKRSIPGLDEEHEVGQLTEYGTASPTIGLSKEDERGTSLAMRAQNGDYDEDLIVEQLARNRVFLTEPGLSKLRAACVVVVGCGGVGSHAAAALARSGVSHIRLIDFDQVTLSSLNRHALATLADVGMPKVHCIRRRLEQVVPWVAFDCRNELFCIDSAPSLLQPFTSRSSNSDAPPSFVIDAIDNVDSKVALLSYCYSHDLPVISSMGAGCKSDPTRIFISDISLSTEDPLSRRTRRMLRAQGIDRGIPVIYSTEKPAPGKAQLLPISATELEKGSVGELGVLPNFRARILPVLGTMPAIFGLSVANYVILTIAGYPRDEILVKGRDKMYDAILSGLQGSEERLAGTATEEIGLKIPVTKEDVAYMVEEVWRGRSAISGLSTRLALIRWEMPEGGLRQRVEVRFEGQKNSVLELGELVCMTREEALFHEREVLKGGKRVADVYKREVLDLVQRRCREEQDYAKYR